VRVDQPLQYPLGDVVGQVQQPRRHRDAQLGAVGQPQQPKRRRGRPVGRVAALVELLVGHLEAGPHPDLGQL
jgi:hypothetical protein